MCSGYFTKVVKEHSMFIKHFTFVLICGFSLSLSCNSDVNNQIEINRIPVMEGIASHPVNGGHCLISDEKFQYIAFYDSSHQMTVGKRKLNESEWDFIRLPERVGWDTHNKIMLFQDRKGLPGAGVKHRMS